MISKFTLQNRTSMQTATFGMDIDCDFVFPGDEGVDWGNVPVNHNTYSYPNQVGDSISNSKITNRDVTINCNNRVSVAFDLVIEDLKNC